MRTPEEIRKQLDKINKFEDLNKELRDQLWAPREYYVSKDYIAGYKAALLWVRALNGYTHDTYMLKQRQNKLEEAISTLRQVFADEIGLSFIDKSA